MSEENLTSPFDEEPEDEKTEYYTVYVRCSNCGFAGTIKVQKGTTLDCEDCPKCGNHDVLRLNDV